MASWLGREPTKTEARDYLRARLQVVAEKRGAVQWTTTDRQAVRALVGYKPLVRVKRRY